MKKVSLTLFGILIALLSMAQSPSASISGRVVDEITEAPLIGATILIKNADPVQGAVTDSDGYFEIEDVAIGRHDLHISYIGYEPAGISQVLVTSGKSAQLNITMKESATEMNEVTVVADRQEKQKPLNEMAAISARSFTVEETRKYAGGFDDPARMATAFAGVASNGIADNGIVIRGNAPKGVQWRIEGVEVPNPSHFQGAELAGAGFFTLLSSQTLANSDFFTAAFPAEYGNALSGVFDINLRKGNSFKREHTFQAGVIGVDFASEGPFKKGSRSTYLFNYRYSTFGLIQPLLPEDASQINYQDLSFKLHFPTKLGTFEVWGVGGHDRANTNNEPSPDSTEWETYTDLSKLKFGFDIGSAGINHKLNIGKKGFLKSILSASINNSYYDEKVIHYSGSLANDKNIDQEFYNYIASIQYNHKHSPKWNSRTGIIGSLMDNYIKVNVAPQRYEALQTISDDNDRYSRFQAYHQSNFTPNEQLTLNVGLHTQYARIVDAISLEPRLGINWNLTDQSTLSFGYGLHSMLEDNKIYAVVDDQDRKINNDLGFTKAHHLVLGFDQTLGQYSRIKLEPYFQYLYDVPVIQDSTFSMLNFTQDWFFTGNLDPTGLGRNYGVDLTIERFLHNDYYYLATFSVFKSEYRDGANSWHPTRYDRTYVANLLAGKEWQLNGSKNRMIGLNLRLNLMGGMRSSPLDMEASMREEEPVLDESRPFSIKQAPNNIADITVTWRKNKKNHSSIWALQVKNALGAKSDFGYSYNYKTNQMEKDLVSIVIPNISYKIEF